jgi:alpha-glucoside transport system substrate-binding protein
MLEEQAPDEIGGEVSLIASWGGNERDVLMKMISPFEAETGITVNYTGTRDMDAVVTTRVQAGNPPDIAAFANPGKMAQFANQGELVDLTGVLNMSAIREAYSEGWLNRGRVDGTLYGIFTKAAMKGFIWYDPDTQSEVGFDVPESWDELMSLSEDIAGNTDIAPWTVGLESGGASGWPGTDWLESIMLKMYGPEVYNQWHRGELAWTSDEVRSVWEEWGRIVTNEDMLYGGTTYTLSTNFGQAHAPIFQEDPAAVFHHQATFLSGFITDQFPDLSAGEDFTFFAFPEIDPDYGASVIAAGDVFTMFNETEQSRALIKYFSTADAQAYWLQTGAISPNNRVALDEYDDPLTREAAGTMRDAQIVVFDASDLMPSELNQQFFSSVMSYVQNPGNLDQILQELDRVRQEAY